MANHLRHISTGLRIANVADDPAGLVPDRDTIADGIGALLILTILVFNFLLVLPLKYFQRHATGK